MHTLVSIVVPCYKQAHYLNETLRSVLNQTYQNWECIIVNDGSPDNTKEIAELWSNKDTRFKYLEKENGGLSSARNAGIRVSKGTFILPLDSDDLLHESFLSLLVPEFEKDKSVAIVTCYSKFFEGNKDNMIYELKPNGTSWENICFENKLIATSLYRKLIWEEVGGYDENMKKGFEDWDFWLAITRTGKTYKVVKEFLFYYRKAKSSMLIDTLQNHRISNMEYILNKYEEDYKNHYKSTIKYLFFLINLHRSSEIKMKNSLEYRIGRLIIKPLRFVKSLFR